MKTFKWDHKTMTVEVTSGSRRRFLHGVSGSPRMLGLGDAAFCILHDIDGRRPKAADYTAFHLLLLQDPWRGWTRDVEITELGILNWRAARAESEVQHDLVECVRA